jgi:sec-independent protein translocase protein TatA
LCAPIAGETRNRSTIVGGGTMLDNLFQPMHLLVILFIALLVFGPKKLPELGKSLGEGIRSFKNSMNPTKPEAEKDPAQK